MRKLMIVGDLNMNKVEWIINESGEIGLLYKNKTYFGWKWHDSFIKGCEKYRLIDLELDFDNKPFVSKYKDTQAFEFAFTDPSFNYFNNKMSWITNQDGELGVFIKNEGVFFLSNTKKENKIRLIMKREFGESYRPPNYSKIDNYIGYHNEDLSLWKKG